MAAPIAPEIAPRKNPVLRPYFCIKGDSQGAVVIEPKTISEMGKVAKHGLPASIPPANPPTINIIGICPPKIAWAATKTATLRFAWLSFGDTDDISLVPSWGLNAP